MRGVKTSVSKSKRFNETSSVLDFIEWRKAAGRYVEAHEMSEQAAVIMYQIEFTSGLAKEMISKMKSRVDVVNALTTRFVNKNTLIQEFKNDLQGVCHPDKQWEAALADYVTSVLTKLKCMVRLAQEEGLEDQLAPIQYTLKSQSSKS